MADLNVFELTNMELHKDAQPSKKPSKKTVKESIKTRKASKAKPFNIPVNKIKLESLRTFLEDEDSDAAVDYTPEDDVVLVIDPDMDEVPEDVEAAEDMAEEMIGDHVCKCSICGANYVTDAEISEDFEMEDETCPVCGETGEQIVVGVITPTEELSDEDSDEIDNVDVEVEDEDGKEEVEAEFEEEDDDFEEAVSRSKMRTSRRRVESKRSRAASKRVSPKKVAESRTGSTIQKAPKKTVAKKDAREALKFDEVVFNRMLTKFAKENYANVRTVKITSGSSRNGKLTLEGVVKTTKGSERPVKFICSDFAPASRMTIKFTEIGPFTESIKNDGATFIVECAMIGKVITPKTLRYSYKAKNAIGMKESRDTYKVSGSVISESARPVQKIKRESVEKNRTASVKRVPKRRRK